MAATMTALLAHHQADLSALGNWLKLELGPGWQPLVIERVGRHQLSVAHYRYQNGDAIADPEIVFYDADPACWLPIYGRLATGHETEAATVRGGQLGAVDTAAAARMKALADLWADNLRAQDWLERAQVVAGTITEPGGSEVAK